MLDRGVPGSLVGSVFATPAHDRAVMTYRATPNDRWTDRFAISRARREAMRTTLWIVPAPMVVASGLLFAVTYTLDRAANSGRFSLPGFITSGSPDAARQILIAIAAAIITVAGVLFSITILVLQLASQQFGPRMLRNFIRDFGTQFSLGAFVATFVYSVLALGSVESAPASDFVPHISVTVALAITLIDLGIVIYFIHHVATTIQLTSVVSGIARDFRSTLANLQADMARATSSHPKGPDAAELSEVVLTVGAPVFAHASGFLQSVGHRHLMSIAVSSDTVIQLVRRPPDTSSSKGSLWPSWSPRTPSARCPRPWSAPTSSGPTAPSPRTWASPSTSSSRWPFGPCRRRSTTPSPRSTASTGWATACAPPRSPSCPTGSTATPRATSASSSR
jgi:uncharacterized membrane protein